MAGLAALCAAAALLLAGAAGQTPTVNPSANFGTNYGVPSPPAGYGNGNDCYLNKVEKVIVTVQANDPVSAIAPTPGSAPPNNPCGAFPTGFVTSPSWNAFLNCTCPIAGTGAGRRRKLQSLDTLLPGATQHVTGMVPAPPGGQTWSSQWGSSGSSGYGDWSGYGPGYTQPGGGGMKFFGECKQNLLTLQATCNFVFDYADRRLLDVLSKIQPAGGIPAGGTLQFQFCSINLGGSVVTSSTCFESYGGNKPVIVKIASRSATDTLPPIGFNACYTDKYGSPNKCLVFTIAQSCTGGVQPSYSNNVPSTQWEASLPGVQKGSASWGQSWGPAPPGWAGSWGGDQSWGQSWGQSWTPSAPPPPGHLASAGAAVDSVISGIASVAGKGLNGAATLGGGGGGGGGGGVGQAAASDWPQQAAQVAEAQATPAAGQQARAQAATAGSAAGRAPAAPAAPAAQATPGAAPQVPAATAARTAGAPVPPSSNAVATATGQPQAEAAAQQPRAQGRAASPVTTTVVGSAGRRHLSDASA